MNLFFGRISAGRIATEADLKRAYRLLAKRLHPDRAAGDSSAAAGPGRPHQDFIRLKADYDEAAAWLAARNRRTASGENPVRPDAARAAEAPRPPATVARCLGLFVDLVASGFPADPRVRASNKAYLRRVRELEAAVDALGSAYAGLFSRAEADVYRLKESAAAFNEPYGAAVLHFYNLSNHFYLPSSPARRNLENSWLKIGPALEERGAAALAEFLKLLTREALR